MSALTWTAGRPPAALDRPRALAAAMVAGAMAGVLLIAAFTGAGNFVDVLCMTTAAGRPATSSKLIYSHALPDIPDRRMTAVLVDFPPGAFSPEHHHEATLHVQVLKGVIRSQLAGEPVQTYQAGDSFFEPLGSVHLFAENVSDTEPAQLLAVYVHQQGARLIVYH